MFYRFLVSNVKLNLGCGRDVKKDSINLDSVKLKGVDKVHNLNKFPYPFKNNYFDEVIAYHILEHLEDLIRVMEELHRICKKDAIIHIKVPYFRYHGAYQDPTHRRFFTLDTFDYFTEKSGYNYYSKAKFEIIKRELIPTEMGKFIPKRFRNFLGFVFGEIGKEIYFKLKVKK